VSSERREQAKTLFGWLKTFAIGDADEALRLGGELAGHAAEGIKSALGAREGRPEMRPPPPEAPRRPAPAPSDTHRAAAAGDGSPPVAPRGHATPSGNTATAGYYPSRNGNTRADASPVDDARRPVPGDVPLNAGCAPPVSDGPPPGSEADRIRRELGLKILGALGPRAPR
jgi:hypothetical protein